MGLLLERFENALEINMFDEGMWVFKAHLERGGGGLIALKGELDASLLGALIDGVANDQRKQRGDDLFVAFKGRKGVWLEFPSPDNGFVFELGSKRTLELFEQVGDRERGDLGLDLTEKAAVVIGPLSEIIEQGAAGAGQLVGGVAFLGVGFCEVLVMFFELGEGALEFGQKLCDGLVELCKRFGSLEAPLGLEFADLLMHLKAEASQVDELLSLCLAELGGVL